VRKSDTEIIDLGSLKLKIKLWKTFMNEHSTGVPQ